MGEIENYTDKTSISITDINPTPIVVGSTHTFGEVFSAVNKIIKAIVKKFDDIYLRFDDIYLRFDGVYGTFGESGVSIIDRGYVRGISLDRNCTHGYIHNGNTVYVISRYHNNILIEQKEFSSGGYNAGTRNIYAELNKNELIIRYNFSPGRVDPSGSTAIDLSSYTYELY